jgi:hypothetical protein
MEMSSFRTPLESCLDPGEKLLWSGQPKQGVRLQVQDIFLIPFSLMWGGFALFWEAMALGIGPAAHLHGRAASPVAWIFPLWGIPFVTVGLYMIFGRFFYDAAIRRKTYYGITNERLIIFKSLFAQSIASFDYGTLASLNLVERGDGSGDILFATPGPMAGFAMRGWPGTARSMAPGFYLLPQARVIYNQIRAAQRQAKG